MGSTHFFLKKIQKMKKIVKIVAFWGNSGNSGGDGGGDGVLNSNQRGTGRRGKTTGDLGERVPWVPVASLGRIHARENLQCFSLL